jgi:hypothetical protein
MVLVFGLEPEKGQAGNGLKHLPTSLAAIKITF